MGASDRLAAAGHTQFAVDAVDVPLHCADGDDEFLRYSRIGQASHQEPQHVEFTFSERFDERTDARGIEMGIRWGRCSRRKARLR